MRRNVAASRLPIAPFLPIRICFELRISDFRLRRDALLVPFRGYYTVLAVRRPQRGFPLLLWRRGGSTRAPRRAGRPIGTPDSFKQPGGAGNPKVEGRRSKSAGEARSSFTGGDYFRAAQLTAETRRARRGKPSPASFLCTAIVCIVRRLQRNFASSCSSTSTFGLLITSEVPASKMRK